MGKREDVREVSVVVGSYSFLMSLITILNHDHGKNAANTQRPHTDTCDTLQNIINNGVDPERVATANI
ncbi:hypothetical protein J6590_076146 [Homalodisca vitripennis]|nr:hypothetical protein J6590_076146 [Homalodisca vitripennis]